MHKIELSNGTQLEFPEYLGEYTNQQYIDFCELLTLYNSKVISYHDFRIKLTYKLINMVHSKKKLSIEDQEQRNENIYKLSLFIDDLFTEKQVDDKLLKIIDLSFIDNKIPSFKHNGTTYYGPEDLILNITFDEFIEAITHFNEFNKSNDITDLDKLVATFYRPKKAKTKHNTLSNYDGDIRQEFFSSNVELRAQELSTLPIHIKMGVKLFFEACINYISTASDVNVMGNEIDLTPLFQGGTSSSKSIGMLAVLFALAKTNVFGTKEQTGKERYWTILLEMYQNHQDVEKQKQQLKDAKGNGA